ncbi:MAG: hypothetical protein AAFX99_09835, partial [Myxococcota bacterium]
GGDPFDASTFRPDPATPPESASDRPRYDASMVAKHPPQPRDITPSEAAETDPDRSPEKGRTTPTPEPAPPNSNPQPPHDTDAPTAQESTGSSPENLRLFRARFQELIKKPASLESSLASIQEIEPLPRTPSNPTSEDDDDLPTLSSIRAQLEVLGVPPRSPTPDETTAEPPAPPTPPEEEDDDGAIARRNAVLAELADIQELSDPGHIRLRLTQLLDTPALPNTLRARIERELGLHCYYELEESEEAEAHLLAATELDPDGIGRDFDVLTAMEGVYEDLKDPVGLVRVYRRKRDVAETEQMAMVYGVLIAQALWERLGQRDEARHMLQTLLKEHPQHEPALQMLANIARSEGAHVEAAQALKQVLLHQIAGSFERQETMRDLGRLMLQAIEEQPDDAKLLAEAIDAWRHLLTEAPGDGEAQNALKMLLKRQGEVAEVLRLLGHELGTLLGQPDAFPEGPTADGFTHLDLSPALALPVSQILTEAAALQQDNTPDAALELLTLAMAIWPDQIEALDLKVELLRSRLEQPSPEGQPPYAEALIQALEQLAALMLNPADQLHVLHEASVTALAHLDRTDLALALLERALESARLVPNPDSTLQARVDTLSALHDAAREENEDNTQLTALLEEAAQELSGFHGDDTTTPGGDPSHVLALIDENRQMDALLDLAVTVAGWDNEEEAARLKTRFIDRVVEMLHKDDDNTKQALHRLRAQPELHSALRTRLSRSSEEPNV